MRDIAKSILQYNQGRIPELVQRKYKLMCEDVFRFYRGTCHLFYEDIRRKIPAVDPTRVWICGDLHLENFGTYKGDNRQVYFDFNDFDEAALAPCTWELGRVLTSIHVAGTKLGYRKTATKQLAGLFLSLYTEALRKGKASMVDKETAHGIVKDLLQKLQLRKRKVFLAQRASGLSGKYPRLRIDNLKMAAPDAKRKKQLLAFFSEQQITRGKKTFRVIDAALRISGTGSLGIERYVLLAFEKSVVHKYYLLDFKEARPSAVNAPSKIKQPLWKNEAERVCEIEKRVQGVSAALLSPVVFDGKSFVLRELQPSQDRVNLELCRGKIKRFTELIETLAEVTASAHLRAGGRQGSSIADELIAFAEETSWQKKLLRFSEVYSLQVKKDYEGYCKKFAEGYFTKMKKPQNNS